MECGDREYDSRMDSRLGPHATRSRRILASRRSRLPDRVLLSGNESGNPSLPAEKTSSTCGLISSNALREVDFRTVVRQCKQTPHTFGNMIARLAVIQCPVRACLSSRGTLKWYPC